MALPVSCEVFVAARGKGAWRSVGGADPAPLRVSTIARWEYATFSMGEPRLLLAPPLRDAVVPLASTCPRTRCHGDLQGSAMVLTDRAEAWIEAGVQVGPRADEDPDRGGRREVHRSGGARVNPGRRLPRVERPRPRPRARGDPAAAGWAVNRGGECAAAAAPPRFRIWDLAVDRVTLAGALDRIEALVSTRRGGSVFTPNVDHVVLARRHQEFRTAYQYADLCLSDGMPLVWASRTTRRGGCASSSQRRPSRGRTLRGSTSLAGTTTAAALRRIELARADVVLVSLGAPKQDLDPSPPGRAGEVGRHRSGVRARLRRGPSPARPRLGIARGAGVAVAAVPRAAAPLAKILAG